MAGILNINAKWSDYKMRNSYLCNSAVRLRNLPKNQITGKETSSQIVMGIQWPLRTGGKYLMTLAKLYIATLLNNSPESQNWFRVGIFRENKFRKNTISCLRGTRVWTAREILREFRVS